MCVYTKSKSSTEINHPKSMLKNEIQNPGAELKPIGA